MLTPFKKLYNHVQNLLVTNSPPDGTRAMGENSMDIEIIQIVDPWNFQAIEKPDSSRSPVSQKFQLMHQDMNQYCNQLIGTEFFKPNVGDVCGALSRDDNLWHRVRIERIISQSHGHQACCLMIDKGSHLTVSALRMMRLPKKFQEFPHHVYQCCLWGVQPITMQIIETDTGLCAKTRQCSTWDPSATEYMQKMVDASHGCQVEIINRDSENIIFLKLYLITKKGLVCFNEALVDENYALKVDNQDFDLRHNRLSGLDDTTLRDTSPTLDDTALRDTSSTLNNTNLRDTSSTLDDTILRDTSSTLDDTALRDTSSTLDDTILRDTSSTMNDTNHRDTFSTLEPCNTKNILQSIIDDMPSLIPHPTTDLQQICLSKVKDNNDNLSFTRHRLFCTDKQEQSIGQQHISNDISISLAQAKSNLSLSAESGIAQGVLPTPFCSRSPIFDQHSLMHNRNNNSDTRQMTSSHDKSPLISSSKLAQLPIMDSLSAAGAVSNFCIGRGRAKTLAKEMSILPQNNINNSPQNESHSFVWSSHSPSHADNITTPPLVAEGNHSSCLSAYSGIIGASPLVTKNPLTHIGSVVTHHTELNDRSIQNESSVLKGSRLKTLQQPNSYNTSSAPSLNNLKINPLPVDNRCLEQFALRDAIGPPVYPHLIEDRMGPSNFQKQNCLIRLQEKIFQQTQRQDHDSDIPVITRQDKPVPRPIFGVVVHGKSVPSLMCDVDDVPFKDCIKSVLKKLDIDTAKSIQAWTWPATLGCRHIVGICPPNHGKTMSYVPAVVSQLLDFMSYNELPPGKGPIALVIVPSWKKGRNVLEMVREFTFSESNSRKSVRSNVLYAGGIEENENNKISLLQGCDILIATPQSLLRMLYQDITSLKRLCHIILDDAEILAARFAMEVETIMQMYKLQLKEYKDQKKCLNVPRQIMIFATNWSTAVEEFYLKYTVEPIIVISSRVEASVYGNVKQIVTMTKWEQRLSTFCGLLSGLSTTRHRVAAFTQDVEEAVMMYQAAKSRGVYCLLIHENLLSETIAETRHQWLQSSYSKHLMVMVCTDDCYQDLAITNATMVINYGLPDSKTRFGNRLACMVDYFLDRTSPVKPDVEPVSQVILTNRCASKAQSLYEILQRCPAEFSPQLEQFLQGYKMQVECDPQKTLCPFLKSFGLCSNQDRCAHRHLVIPEQDFKTGEVSQNTLPSSGEVKIRITRVENASRFYCQLVYHRSVPDNVKTDLRLEYQRLMMEMIYFFSKESNHAPFVPSDNPFLDDICAFKDSNKTFQRVKVLEVRKGSINAPMKCNVWLVDSGCHQIITMDQLLKLPQRLAEVPYQAVEVYLCCVKPLDSDTEWTCEADTYINDLIQGKELVGRIMLRVGMTLWLLPLVHQVTLKNVGVTSDINIRQKLLENNFGTPNPEHVQKLYEIFRGNIDIPEKMMRQYFDYALEMETLQETLTRDDTFNEVIIAAVISPGLLYVQKWDNFELLEKLQAQIADVMSQKNESDGTEKRKVDADIKLEQGSVCLALSSDGRWYRAKIVSNLKSGQWGVFFLDYGDRENISEDNLRPLPRELAELPCQAIECELAYIQPKAEKWGQVAVDVICDLAYFVNGDKKRLFAKVVGRLDPHYGIRQKLVIDLYDGCVRFSQELVWRQIAKCAEESDTIKDLLEKPALKSQLFFNNWDKIPYLCAYIYWSEIHSDAIQQANELRDILSIRNVGWESDVLQREVLASAFKVVGYIPDIEAHSIILDCLVSCCSDSNRLTDIAVSENLASRLAYCLEQVSRPRVQLQVAQAVAQLVNIKRFCDSLVSSDCLLVNVLVQFMNQPQTSNVDLQTLKCVCSASAQLAQADESFSTELKSAQMVEQIFSSLQQTSADTDREPWLKLLAAIATCESSHKCLMREAHVAALLKLLLQSLCCKCQFYLLSVCQSLVQYSRRHKVILLESKLLIILNDLEAGGLRSPALEACKQLQADMTLRIPEPESLAGLPVRHVTEVAKMVSPHVTWSQNCFRLVLNVKVRDAKVEDFLISESRICCRCVSNGAQYELDWELYDTILPAQCKVHVYASYSLVSLWKQAKGIWSRLLKQKIKLPNLSLDYDHPYDSADEDVEDADNLTTLTKKKDIFNQEEMWNVKRVSTYQSSEESSDELAIYSHSSDDEPAIDVESLMTH